MPECAGIACYRDPTHRRTDITGSLGLSIAHALDAAGDLPPAPNARVHNALFSFQNIILPE